jgi:uncharacterized membrane protein
MSQLLVFGLDSPQTAEKVLDLGQDLAKQQLLELATPRGWNVLQTARSSFISR